MRERAQHTAPTRSRTPTSAHTEELALIIRTLQIYNTTIHTSVGAETQEGRLLRGLAGWPAACSPGCQPLPLPLPLPLTLTLPLPLPLLLPPPLTSPPFPTRLRHPTPLPDRPTTRPTVHPSTPLLSLPPTSPALFHLPTNPTSNASHQRSVICGLSNSLRGLLLPETLPLSLPPFLYVSLRPKTTFHSPLSFSLLP